MCACVCVSVVLDHRSNSSCDTGRFELVYRATANPYTRGSDMRFVVEGQRINKVDLQRYVAIDRRMMKQQQQQDAVINDAGEEPDVTTPTPAAAAAISPLSVDRPATTGQPAARTVTQAASPERLVNSSSSKAYRGLRPSTVQIYNGR